MRIGFYYWLYRAIKKLHGSHLNCVERHPLNNECKLHFNTISCTFYI